MLSGRERGFSDRLGFDPQDSAPLPCKAVADSSDDPNHDQERGWLMPEKINPTGIAPPASHYNHGLLIKGVSDLLTLSGQLGERPDGSCPESAGEQAEVAWTNVREILETAGFDVSNIVKITSYIVGKENIDAYVDVHKSMVGDLLPPWTLVVVEALGHPHYLVEVDVMAAARRDA